MKRSAHRTGALLLAVAAIFAAALLLAPGRAEASVSGCSVSSSGIAFSPYDSQTKAAVTGTGTISVTCTGSGNNTNLSLNITGGNNGTCTSRQMRNAGTALIYDVFQDAARVTNWCDGGSKLDINMNFATPGTQTVTFTMYGRVNANQNPVYRTTDYTDTLTVTLKQGGGSLTSTTIPVSGSVAAICTVSAGSLGFGTYNTTTAALATATVTVNCSNGATYQVGLGGGSNLNGTTRRMAGPGGARLSYDLFSNSGRTTPWGDGTALGAKVSGTGSGANQGLIVYGRIPAAQLPSPGSYTDSVVVTVDY